MGIETIIIESITSTAEKITGIILEEHPNILADMATKLFAKHGAFNGRERWKSNAWYTISKKGGNKPNIDTGNLKQHMTTPGFLENDGWLDSLTVPPKRDKRTKTGLSKNASNPNGYKDADALRPFSDIGRTDSDEQYIEKKLEKIIAKELKNGSVS